MQRPRLGGMGWPRDRCDPAGLCQARIRQPSRSLPGRRELISIQAAPYAREKRGPLQDAMRKVWKEIQSGQEWIVDGDLKDFFGSVDHEKLLTLVAQRVADGRVLRLIQAMLKA